MTRSVSPYIRLCSRATIESLRNHPTTRAYVSTFFGVAKRNGLAHARAWLLGRLLMDLHPEPGPKDELPQPHTQLTLPYDEPANAPRARLQQHIEAAATQLDNTPTPF